MTLQQLNKEQFEQLMNQDQKPVLVEFQAPWCGYCRRIAAAMEKVQEQFSDTLAMGQVNIDDQPELEEQEHIEVIPTLVIYQNGKALGSIVAPESKARIERFIRETLGK